MSQTILRALIATLTPAFFASCGEASSSPAPCPAGQLSPVGILRSADQGAHWASLGNVCTYSTTLQPADTVALAVDGAIVLYFVDLAEVSNPAATEHHILRTRSTDGVHFTKPTTAYSQIETVVDPTVTRMPDGSFLLYFPGPTAGTITRATSSDGVAFRREGNVSLLAEGGTTEGLVGMPAALPVGDAGQVRLYVCGGRNGKTGIFSYLSQNGVDFVLEKDPRIEASPGRTVDDPAVVRLATGGYLMSHSEFAVGGDSGPNPWIHDYHLATSPDAVTWTDRTDIFGRAGTSGLAQAADGSLFFYYGGLPPD